MPRMYTPQAASPATISALPSHGSSTPPTLDSHGLMTPWPPPPSRLQYADTLPAAPLAIVASPTAYSDSVAAVSAMLGAPVMLLVTQCTFHAAANRAGPPTSNTAAAAPSASQSVIQKASRSRRALTARPAWATWNRLAAKAATAATARPAGSQACSAVIDRRGARPSRCATQCT